MTATYGVAASTDAKQCANCTGAMTRVEVSTNLTAHLPGNTPDAYWTATTLDSWMCLACGKTELYARNPAVFKR